MAPRHGFEPRFTAPKAAVLPLDDRGMLDVDSSSLTGATLFSQRLLDAATISPEGNLDWCLGRSSKPFVAARLRGLVREGYTENVRPIFPGRLMVGQRPLEP